MRTLIRLCFRRPVAVGFVTALLVVLAAVAYVRLPVALLPDLGYPALTVWMAYPDVPPERVEETVSEPVEEAVAGIEGLRRVTARSQLGGSLVETDDPMYVVCWKVGYSSDNNGIRAFRLCTGMTMEEYRKQYRDTGA